MKKLIVKRRAIYEETYQIDGNVSKEKAVELIATMSGKAQLVDCQDITGFELDYNKEAKNHRYTFTVQE